MSYGYKKYVTAAEKRKKAEKSQEKLRRKNTELKPIVIEGRNLAHSWWGKAWNSNLESYADYRNRIARGKSYVRSGSVLDLRVESGVVRALVQGSRAKPYEVLIQIKPMADSSWQEIKKLCNRKIESLEQLMEGQFPKDLEALLTDRKKGLFPSPKEIQFDCSCPDWASMCKHVAAVLYGIGARLDHDPMLFFELRGQKGQELIKASMDTLVGEMLKNAGVRSKREIAETSLPDIFHL